MVVMKKKLHIMMSAMLLMLAGTVMTACSSDDDVDFIKVDFQLQNEDGIECYDFNEGDNVIFDLIISNNSNGDISYGPKNADIIFGNDMFCVYSDDDSSIGLPWTGMYCEFTGQKFFIIPANTVKHIYCPWNLCKEIDCSHPLCKGEDKEKLPAGNYYSRFSIKIKNKTTTRNRTFIIK